MNQQLDETSSRLEHMIQTQVIDRGIHDPRVLAALRAIPRARFFPSEQSDAVFADRASPIGHGQTISQPYMVALMTNRLSVQPNHQVLEVGTGSGYQTAILAKLAERVYTIERVKPLLDSAFERLMELGVRNVSYHFGDGTRGWPTSAEQQPLTFDRILVAAGAPVIPRELLMNQLRDGGIAVLPVGKQDEQMLLTITRKHDTLSVEEVTPVRFVRLIGQEGWPEE